jgi:hypothetical protein
MNHNFTTLISTLEESCDAGIAYFSYTADERGDRGMIRANKEGLRMYALDLLRKSVQMEEKQDGKNLCFKQCDWVINEAGYNLITGVKPEYASRETILASAYQKPGTSQENMSANKSANKGCMGTLILLAGSLASIGAVIKKCFL